MKISTIVFAAALFIISCFSLSAEMITLKNGSLIMGHIYKTKNNILYIETRNGDIQLPKKAVKNIKSYASGEIDMDLHPLENWYQMFMLGFTKNMAGSTSFGNGFALNLMRFYWRMAGSKHGLIGTSMYASHIETETTVSDMNFIGISFQFHFNRIGKGLYLRSDMGASFIDFYY